MDDLNKNFLNGAGEVPTTFFPKSSPFYNPAIKFPKANAKKAQRLLNQLASDGHPVSFTIVTPPSSAADSAIYLQTQLSRFKNLDVHVKSIDGPTFGISLFSGDFDMAAYSFTGTDPEPSVARMRTTHPVPIASMGSAVIDEAVQEGRTAPDIAGRKAAYDKLTKDLNKQYKMKWMSRDHAWVVETPGVTGIASYGQGSQLWDAFGYVR